MQSQATKTPAKRRVKTPASETPLYSIGTWDTEQQAYTPQAGLTVPCVNVPWRTLLEVLRQLKSMGYSCHRFRDADGSHDENDTYVLVERTDGKPFEGSR
jgi:hypothetical protein